MGVQIKYIKYKNTFYWKNNISQILTHLLCELDMLIVTYIDFKYPLQR